MPQPPAFSVISRVIADVADELDVDPGSRHVILTGEDGSGRALVAADLVDDAVDRAPARVKDMGPPAQDVVLPRLDSIAPTVTQHPLATIVWANLLSQAGANARPIERYLVFMAAAGVIAAFGVIYPQLWRCDRGARVRCLIGGPWGPGRGS